MTVTRRIRVGFLWVTMMVFVLAGMALGWAVWMNGWKTDYAATVTQVDDANEIVVGEACMLDYVLLPLLDQSTESRPTYTSQLESYTTMARDALASATSLETDPEDVAALETLNAAFAQYERALSDAVGLAATDPVKASAKATGELLPLAQQVHVAADSYREGQKAEGDSLLDTFGARSKIIIIVMMVVALMAITGGTTGGVLISRTIAKQLGRAFFGISNSTAHLMAVASQVAASTAQTAASTNETTATVEEVKQTAELAHEKATRVAESSQRLASVAEAGQATVRETIAGFDRMQDQMALVSETINQLGEQTQAVGEIIATVNDLAEQSNLLSVNASIEAAKAGDQGKGFTVVAQEVKNLAEQSKQAVAQVRTILSEIQKASGSAVRAAEQGQETVAVGRQQSLESGESVFAITETAIEAAQSAVQISASSRQQLAGMEQISYAVNSINEAGNQSVAGTREVEDEAKRLQVLALSLKRLIDSRATA